jgi:hypothetical protein
MSDFAGVGAGSSAAGRAAFYDQPSHGDLPDDFKVGFELSLGCLFSDVVMAVWCYRFGEFG